MISSSRLLAAYLKKRLVLASQSEEIKERLKGNIYKSKAGNDVTFSTAYAEQNSDALHDYMMASLEYAKEKGQTLKISNDSYPEVERLSVAQSEVIEDAFGINTDNMTVGQEDAVQEVIEVVAHATDNDEDVAEALSSEYPGGEIEIKDEDSLVFTDAEIEELCRAVDELGKEGVQELNRTLKKRRNRRDTLLKAIRNRTNKTKEHEEDEEDEEDGQADDGEDTGDDNDKDSVEEVEGQDQAEIKDHGNLVEETEVAIDQAGENPEKLYSQLPESGEEEKGARGEVQRAVRERLLPDLDFDMSDSHFSTMSGRALETERRAQKQKHIERFNKLTEEQRDELSHKMTEVLKGTPEGPKRSALLDAAASLIVSQALKDGATVPGIDPQILKLAKHGDSSIAEAAKNALTQTVSTPKESGRREARREFFDGLSHDSWVESMGGKTGSFGSVLEKMDPNYCPANSENGDLGGKTLKPGQTCPKPLSDKALDRMRAFVTSMNIDGMSFQNTEKKKEKGPEGVSRNVLKKYMESEDGADYMDALQKNDTERADKHEATMRAQSIAAMETHSPLQEAFQSAVQEVVEDWDGNSSLDQLESAFDIEPTEDETETDGELGSFFIRASLIGLSKKIASVYLNNLFIKSRYNSGGHMKRVSTVYTDYQQRAKSFSVGDKVYPFFGGDPSKAGVVVAVYPGIGMVDVQYPHGSTRLPVEDLVLEGDEDLGVKYDSVPGGAGSYPVSSANHRVASTFLKQSIYWAAKDRKYLMSQGEETPTCPKCRVELKRTSYKKRWGRVQRLLACPSCLFLIKPDDILNKR